MGGRTKQRAMKTGLGVGAIERLAKNLSHGHRSLDQEAFVGEAVAGLDELELKDRVKHVADALGRHLAPDFPEAVAAILRCLPHWDRGDCEDPLRGFAAWPLFQYIEVAGIEHCSIAMDALADLTHLFSAEFAIRPYVERYPQQAMKTVASWTEHSSDQVRRLASEGIRPRLPWGGRLRAFEADPAPVLEILERLKDDASLYVRRSVANNLADVAVAHPDRVIDVCSRWLAEHASEERRWLVRRATRNLIKSGHPGVWALHGFTVEPEIVVDVVAPAPETVALGERFVMKFQLRSKARVPQRLVVDFVIHHVKASGATTAKVFKLKELELLPGQELGLEKAHAFRDISTRTYYSGTHRIELQVNGQRFGQCQVELII